MASATQHFDAVVIGAGFSGMYMLKSLRDTLGLKVRVYEAGDTVGGTWYWNRYPGARCDSDAYIYVFTFDKQTNLWMLRTDKGEAVTARYLIAAVGSLSHTNMPQFKGLEKFKGTWYHTSRFPHSGVDFTN